MFESLFNKVAGETIKRRLQHRCFPVKLMNFLRTPFFYRIRLVAASVFFIIILVDTEGILFLKIKIHNYDQTHPS